jgi:hypothetical protein
MNTHGPDDSDRLRLCTDVNYVGDNHESKATCSRPDIDESLVRVRDPRIRGIYGELATRVL